MSITAELPNVLEEEVEVELDGCSECDADECDAEPTEEAGDEAAPASGFFRQTVAYRDFQNALSDATARLATTVLERLKAEAAYKLAKAEEKAAGEALQKIVNRGVENYPLFDAESKAEESTEPTDESGDESDSDEAWRAVEIGVINVPESILNKLIEAGIETVGQLADWSENGKKLTDIDGIGLAKVEKIEAAMDEFWASRSE